MIRGGIEPSSTADSGRAKSLIDKTESSFVDPGSGISLSRRMRDAHDGTSKEWNLTWLVLAYLVPRQLGS